MTKLKPIHWLAIAATLLLTVLLFFAPKMGELHKTETANNSAKVFDIQHYTDSVKLKLDTKTQALILTQQSIIDGNEPNNTFAFDSLSKIYMLQRLPVLAAFVKVRKAKATNAQIDLAAAADECYKASKFVAGNEQAFLMENAIDCYKLVLEKDTSNLDYKTNLGICYVEGSREPMQGIMMLRSVVAKDSTNLKAQLSLGMFAIQSGQNDKAITRFNKIIVMHPQYAESYLYLAQAYTNVGNKQMAIKSLENFKKVNTDKTVETEIDNYIQELTTK